MRSPLKKSDEIALRVGMRSRVGAQNQLSSAVGFDLVGKFAENGIGADLRPPLLLVFCQCSGGWHKSGNEIFELL
jgi:hypothetical protein